MGTGFYVAFALLGAPLNERLLAATRTQGTIAFLVFLSDCCGYAVSVALLLYNDFGVPETSNTTATDDAATATGDANAAELHTFLKGVEFLLHFCYYSYHFILLLFFSNASKQ